MSDPRRRERERAEHEETPPQRHRYKLRQDDVQIGQHATLAADVRHRHGIHVPRPHSSDGRQHGATGRGP